MDRIKLPVRVVKVLSGSQEVEIDRGNYVFPYSKLTTHTGDAMETPDGALMEAGVKQCTMFSLGDHPSGTVFAASDWSYGGKFFNVYDSGALVGSGDHVIKIYLLNDPSNRYIQVTLYISGTNQITCQARYIDFYKNGTRSFRISNTQLSLYNNDTLRLKTLPFPAPDGSSCYGFEGYDGYDSQDTPFTRCNRYIYSLASGSTSTWLTDFDPEYIDDNNPYFDGGTSEEERGDSNFSEESDTVTVDPLPTIDAVGTGFATLFTPTKAQLKDLSTIMWNGNVFAALQNLVENIHGMFTSLAIVPFVVEAGSTVEVTWFGLAITEVYLTLASKQFYEFDMGSISFGADDERIFTTGTALDYSPFSKLGIFLPFIGFQSLDVDECRGGIINLKYRIDILSGTCVALVSVDGRCIYQFTGNCLTQIPITNQSMQSLVSDAVQVGIAAAATHSAKGAVASAGEELSSAQTVGQQNTAETHLKQAESHLAQTRSALASATANAAMGIKPDYGKTGAVSASAALLAVKQPYLFLTTPRQSIPAFYEKYGGFPCNITGKLSEFSGLTVVEDIRLNGLVATSDEVAEIYRLLKEGVII